MKRFVLRGFVISVMFYNSFVVAATNCTLTVTPISFGKFNALNRSATTVVGQLHVLCTGPSETFAISLSTGDSGSYNPRLLKSASTGALLQYNLYTDANHTLIWGDGTGGTSVVTGMTGNCAHPNGCIFLIYGNIPPNQSTANAASDYQEQNQITAMMTYP